MKEKIKIGYVGLGRRGMNVLKKCFAEMEDVEVAMICDTYEPFMQETCDYLVEKGLKKPILTTDYDDIISNPDIDAVVIMTGWENRPALARKAMLAGKYTAIEVGGAFDLGECYSLVEAYEESGTPLMMLENCCYDRREMMALNIAEKGLFGEIAHCAGGYHHYLPDEELFKDMGCQNPHYRITSYEKRNCENYPTHELGPISKLLKINRGNRMLTLSSFSSKAVGLKDSAKRILGEDSPYANKDYKQGDIVTTVITCANGETIQLTLDTTLPRPYYSRNFTVRGTKGMFTEERKVLFFEGMKEPVENNEEEMFEKYDHPLYTEYLNKGRKGGHGGMDYLVCRAFVESVKNGTNTPIDIYDSVTWLAVSVLSEMSIEKGGAPINFPDFTKGKWMDREPVVEGKYCLDKVCIDESTAIY